MLVYKFTSPNRRSVPDRMIVAPHGPVFFIEFKRPGGKTTAGQDREIERLLNQNVSVYVVDDVDQGKVVIESMVGL